MRNIVVPPADSLMFNTPWLWTGNSQLGDLDGTRGLDTDAALDEGFSSWWDFGNL